MTKSSVAAIAGDPRRRDAGAALNMRSRAKQAAAMKPTLPAWWKQTDLLLYLTGHAAVLAGAALMHYTGSMLPMALGASAGLMFAAPLVKKLLARLTGRSER